MYLCIVDKSTKLSGMKSDVQCKPRRLPSFCSLLAACGKLYVPEVSLMSRSFVVARCFQKKKIKQKRQCTTTCSPATHAHTPARFTHHSLIGSVPFCLQAIFASSIPEIIDLVGTRSKYCGEYKREHGKRYIYLYVTRYRFFQY